MDRAQKPQEDDATRGLTLRELVLEVRNDGKDLKAKFGLHLVEHARTEGVAKGEAKVFGMARSAIAIAIALISMAVTVISAVGPVLAGGK